MKKALNPTLFRLIVIIILHPFQKKDHVIFDLRFQKGCVSGSIDGNNDMSYTKSPSSDSEPIESNVFSGSALDEVTSDGDSSGNEISFVDPKYLCVGIVDIVNSTKITADIDDPENVAKYYSIFINTMAVIARSFGGEVIKNIGDSIVLFFPKTSVSSHDKTSFKEVLRCGLTMGAAHTAMNEKYRDFHLPPIDFRISADYGKIEVAKSGPSRVVDVFGPTVNMCAKMNSKAPLNGLIIGGDLYQIIKGLHESSTSFNIKQMGAYSIEGLKAPAYPLYHVTTDAQLATPAIVTPNQPRSNPLADPGHSLDQREQKLKVMLIDDEPDMIITYKSFLHSEGYSVDAFSNSQEALRHFTEVNPSYYDLIIMDIRMPHLNGLQLYNRMKAINSSVRVLFVSALDAVEELVSVLPDIKRNSIIRKPIEKDHFVKSVQLAMFQ
jgi:two-component system, OmpR family, response regulator ChvI